MERLDYWNEEEFKEVYDQYFSMIYRISLLYLRNTEEAEDIVQEVFLKLLDKGRNFNSEEHRKSWLIEVTKNNGIIRAEKFKGNKLRPIIALSLAFILSITAFAVSNNYQDFSNRLIDWSISEGATQINISDTDSGYKITAESLFGDSKVVYVMFSIEREDGKEINIREKDGRTNFGVKTSGEYI